MRGWELGAHGALPTSPEDPSGALFLGVHSQAVCVGGTARHTVAVIFHPHCDINPVLALNSLPKSASCAPRRQQ